MIDAPPSIVVLTPVQLQAIVSQAVEDGVRKATEVKTFNLTEFASRLGISGRTLSRRIAEGQIPGPGPTGRWTMKEVSAWLDRQEEKNRTEKKWRKVAPQNR
jgi:predicted DNA-binding transcriptional regulator AlpA